MKKVVWNYNPSNQIMSVDHTLSVNAALEAQFTFKLERLKDVVTFEEHLKITNYVMPTLSQSSAPSSQAPQPKFNGTIETSLPNLATDINQFREYGVAIGVTYLRDLAKQIELHYMDIPVITMGGSGDNQRFDSLIDAVKEYLESSDGTITESFCYIPVKMFQQLSEDCGYRPYEMRSLREKLANCSFLHTFSGRYTTVKRLGSKPERALAFYREKLGISPPITDKEKKGSDEK